MNKTIEANKFIRLKRQQCGLNQKELANLAGLSESEISKIENGYRKVTLDSISKLNKVLKFTENEMKNILNVSSDNLTIYNSYASKLDNVFTSDEIVLVETLSKIELIKLKNYIHFLTNKKISFEDKEAVNTLVKSLYNKNN